MVVLQGVQANCVFRCEKEVVYSREDWKLMCGIKGDSFSGCSGGEKSGGRKEGEVKSVLLCYYSHSPSFTKSISTREQISCACQDLVGCMNVMICAAAEVPGNSGSRYHIKLIVPYQYVDDQNSRPEVEGLMCRNKEINDRLSS